MTLAAELWSILSAQQRRRVLGAQLVSLAMAFSAVTGIAAIGPFFAVLAQPRLTDRNPALHWLYVVGEFHGDRSFVFALGAVFIALVVFANLVSAWGSQALSRLSLQTGAELQTALFTDYLARPYPFHVATNSTVLFNNVIYETARVADGMLQNALILLTNLVVALFVFGSILLLKPAFSVVLLAALAAGYGGIYLRMRNRLLRLGQTHSRAWSERAKLVNESFGAIRELLLAPDLRTFHARFEQTSREVARTNARIQLVGQIPRHVMECVAVAGLVVAALLPGGHAEGMGAWLGQLTFVGFAAYRLLPSLQQIFVAAVRIRADRPALALIASDLRRARACDAGWNRAVTSEIASAPARAREDSAASQDPWWQHRPQAEIALRNVSFRYASAQGPALASVDIRIPAYSTVALVGANGSGKTTLMDLIAGLLEPNAGELSIDGVAVDAVNRSAWQARLAYVPQNVFLLDSSIAENIAFGIPPERIDRARLEEAARLAQLHDFIATLPDGYDHVIGERGIRLSGGQRQRIGIARGLYKDAELLLLDEAMSALDGMTESELIAALASLRGKRTIVLVAHRVSLVRWCDLIFQLDNGRIVANGSYDELDRRSVPFRRMIGS